MRSTGKSVEIRKNKGAAAAGVDDIIPVGVCRKPSISPPIAANNNNTAAMS